MPGFTSDEVSLLAASLEAGSEHPLAAAILRGAEARGLVPDKVADFGAVTGQGVTGRIGARNALLGNQRLMEGAKIVPPPSSFFRPRRGGKRAETVMFLGVDGKLAGLVIVADPIKPTAAEAIAEVFTASD